MLLANQDQGLDCAGQLCQVDHVLASVVALDTAYLGAARVASSWLDFRYDASADVQFGIRTGWFAPGVATDTWPWTTADGVAVTGTWPLNNTSFFGDIDAAANARVHAHLFHPFSAGVGGDTQPYTVTVSFAGQAP